MQGRYKSKRAEVLAMLLAGKSPKEAARAHGANRSYGSKVALRHGLSPMYVSDDERNTLLTMRAWLTARTLAKALRSLNKL